MIASRFRCKWLGDEPAVDQGLVHGLPATWNPDDSRFYLHKIGNTDGASVLGTFKNWGNAVHFAKRKTAERRV